MRRVLPAAVLVLGVLSVVPPAWAQDRPRVVAVNYPLRYFAERLLGDAAEVVYPVPGGVDPAFWRPTVADIGAIQSADLVLLNGAGFATWTTRVSLQRSRLVDSARGLSDRLIATETITHSHGDDGAHSHAGTASHIWLDPELASLQAEALAAAFASRGLAPADEVYARFDELRADLERLDETSREALRAARGVPMVATHPRYQYLARAFGLTIVSLEWDAGAMPGEADLADLEALVGESGARVLIWEAEPPAEARAAVAALGLRDVVFPTLASPPSSGDFTERFAASVAALAAAAQRVPGD